MLKNYMKTLQFRGMDVCSSQILSELYESFPKDLTLKQLAKKTGKKEQAIKNKVKAMERRNIPIQMKNGSQREPRVHTSLFEPVSWILKEKENAQLALDDFVNIKPNANQKTNKKKKIVVRIYKEYIEQMDALIDRWYSLQLIQNLKDE
tara:strand:- start:255 stop:701 length:447 start_codon:yes stop_codon:yes gene_type:complete